MMYDFFNPEYIPKQQLPVCFDCGKFVKEFENKRHYCFAGAKYWCKVCEQNVCHPCKNGSLHKMHKTNKLKANLKKVYKVEQAPDLTNKLITWLRA